jgi:hypothetical protein
MLDKGENPRQENKERPYFIGSGDGTEGGEGGHHHRALVVGEEHPVALKGAHRGAGAFGAEEADANDCCSSTLGGSPPCHSARSSDEAELAGGCEQGRNRPGSGKNRRRLGFEGEATE